mgnify:FL=1
MTGRKSEGRECIAGGKKVMKKPKYSICCKITALLLFMVLSAMMLTGGVSFAGLYSMKNISEKSSKELGETAASDAEEALEEMAGEQLLSIATEKAAYIEEKFKSVIACVDGIAQAAEDIYRHPEIYPDRDVPLPEKNSRALAAQIMWSKRLGGESGYPEEGPAVRLQPSEAQMAELFKLGNLQDMLVQYNRQNKMISSVYLATQSGWMLQADYIAYSKYSDDSEYPDYFEADEREWYRRALEAGMGEVVYSDVMKDYHEGIDCIVCAKAVYLNGEAVAVAGVGSYLNTVHEAVLETVIGDDGYAFLINRKVQVMVSGAESGGTAAGETGILDLRESSNTELAMTVNEMLCGKRGLTKLMLDGREVYLAYAPLKELGWSFVTVMGVEEVIEPAKQSQQLILELTDSVSMQQNEAMRRMVFWFWCIVCLTALLFGMGSILFAGKLTAPIRRLTAEVEWTGEGDLEREIRITTGDEVERLGDAFNDMRKQLKEYIRHLASAAAEKERIRTELDLASRIQADMLPDFSGAFDGRKEFILHARMTPAKDVGGDFYDFFLIDEEHLAFLIADVSGKGIPAALFMVIAKTLLQSRIAEGISLAQAVTEVNQRLCAENDNGMFVTAWIGVLALSTGVLTYVNAGHNPPLLGNSDNEYDYIRGKCGFVLAGMSDTAYEQRKIRLVPGNTIFLYTDGVSETNNENGILYGEERLRSLLNERKSSMPAELTESVWESIQTFQGNAEEFDDVTMLALQYFGGGGAHRGPNDSRMREQKRDQDDESGILTVSAELSYMDAVQTFIEGAFGRKKVSCENIRRMLIASDEIFSNICLYSGAKEVIISCRVRGNQAVLALEDDGEAFNPLEKEPADTGEPLENRKEGGLGIHIIRKLMDAADYQYDEKNKRNRLILKMDTTDGRKI